MNNTTNHEMKANISLTAADGGWRVAIVDAADELNPNGANALLKILEEPPAKSILILVSHAPGRLLPTIRSRCQQLPLMALSVEDTLEVLSGRHPELGAEEARKLAVLSDGRPGWGSTLVAEGGLELYQDVLGLCAYLPRIKSTDVHKLAERITARGKERRYELFMDLLLGWISELVRQSARGDKPREIEGREAEIAEKMLSQASLDRWLEVWEKMAGKVRATAGLHLDKKGLLLELCHLMQNASKA